MDIEAWLRGLGLEQYVETFAANDVDLNVLTELTEDDLVTLGVSLGHRKKILWAIRQIVSEEITAEAPSRPEYASPSRYTPGHLADRIRAARGFLKGERKQVTILFADIKGSLELIDGSDPEQALAILDVAVRTMMDAVHRYEGTVNKVLGDGIMALFGAPIGLEDHAARACYAALAMIEAIASKAVDIRRDHGVKVQVRVGLHSGEVVVREIRNDLAMDYDAIGPTTHLAGRMEQLAPPGTARLSADTARLAEGFIEARSLGPVPVKGLKDPVEVFELKGAAEGRSRFQAAVARGLSRFVGREAEMAALNDALDRAGKGQGQVVATIGEPGLGKSRLYYEFVRTQVVAGWLVLATGSVSYGKGIAYLPVVDLLKGYFQIESRDTPRGIREKATGKLLTLDEGLRSILTPILSLLDVPVDDATWGDLDPAQRRRRTIAAIKTLLMRESREQPLVVIFEDLHWIDGETQAVLDALVESLPMACILLLVNYRPEYGHGWGSRTYYTQRRLEPLPQESAEALLDTLVGEDPALDPLKRILIERTEGNPFFVEESVRTLVEAGALTGPAGVYRQTGDVNALEIPASVQGVLAARIDRLSALDKRLLQSAAVVGKDVPFALLQAVVEIPEDQLNAGLSALQGAEFLYETRLYPEREYTFKHALTHEVAYGSLLRETRSTLHRKIAAAMERLYADRLAEQWERMAHHCTEAGLTDKAVTYWQRAGQRALQRSAYPEAITQLTKGLTLLKTLPDSPQRARQELAAHLAVGPALLSTKGWAVPEVEQAYLRARELAEHVGQPADLFAALWGLWLFNHTSGRMEAAKNLTAEVLSLAEREADPDLLLQAHHAGWTTDFHSGDILSCRHHAEQGIALYKREKHHALSFLYGGHNPGMCCRANGSAALWLLGYADQALVMAREAASLAREVSHPFSLVIALSSLAMLHQQRRESGLTIKLAEATIALCSEQEISPHYLAMTTVLRGWGLANTGQAEEGIEQMRQGLFRLQAMRAARGRMYYMCLLAESYAATGKIDLGLTALDEAINQVETTGERWWEADIHRLKGQLLISSPASDQAEAESCFTWALNVARRKEARSLELRVATSLAGLWRQQGNAAKARDLLAPIYGWFTEGFDTSDLKNAKTLLDELACVRS